MTQTKTTDGVYKAEDLHQFAQGAFEKLGMRSADADILADHLVWADLRGITWLGMRKIPQYGSRFRAGGTPPKFESKTVLDTPSVVVVDESSRLRSRDRPPTDEKRSSRKRARQAFAWACSATPPSRARSATTQISPPSRA